MKQNFADMNVSEFRAYGLAQRRWSTRDEDKIVPPNQAEMMVEALQAKGLPVAYVLYEGEQQGFRKAENIKRTLDGELYF